MELNCSESGHRFWTKSGNGKELGEAEGLRQDQEAHEKLIWHRTSNRHAPEMAKTGRA